VYVSASMSTGCRCHVLRSDYGTRQGGILSPTLFSRYIHDLLAEVTQLHVGLFVNVLAYADDIVLLVPSWSALQHLLSVLRQHVSNIDMMCNTKKSVCI